MNTAAKSKNNIKGYEIDGASRDVGSTARLEAIIATKMLALSQSNANSVQTLGATELLHLQSLLGHGGRFGYWETPQSWAPTTSAASQLKVDLRKRITQNLPSDLRQIVQKVDDDYPIDGVSNLQKKETRTAFRGSREKLVIDYAVLFSLRYLVLLRIGPVGLGRKGSFSSLDPSSLRQLAYQTLPKMASLVITKLLGSSARPQSVNDREGFDQVGDRFFSFLADDDISDLNAYRTKTIGLEILRMRMLNERGYWTDAPTIGFTQSAALVTSNGGRAFTPQITHEPHTPLPDEYVSKMGSHSLWLIEELGPNLLRIGEGVAELWRNTYNASSTPSEIQHIRRSQLKKYLCECDWRTKNGHVIGSLPFLCERSKSELKVRDRSALEENGLRESKSRNDDDEEPRPGTTALN